MLLQIVLPHIVLIALHRNPRIYQCAPLLFSQSQPLTIFFCQLQVVHQPSPTHNLLSPYILRLLHGKSTVSYLCQIVAIPPLVQQSQLTLPPLSALRAHFFKLDP